MSTPPVRTIQPAPQGGLERDFTGPPPELTAVISYINLNVGIIKFLSTIIIILIKFILIFILKVKKSEIKSLQLHCIARTEPYLFTP